MTQKMEIMRNGKLNKESHIKMLIRSCSRVVSIRSNTKAIKLRLEHQQTKIVM